MVIPVIIAVVIVQVLLSQKANRYWVFLLPALSFVASILLCIVFALFGSVTWQCTMITTDGKEYVFETEAEAEAFRQTLDEDDIVSETVIQPAREGSDMQSYVIYILRLFFSTNVVTIILLLIYWRQRKHLEKGRQHI